MKGAYTFHLTKSDGLSNDAEYYPQGFSYSTFYHYDKAQVYGQFGEKSKAPSDNVITNRQENLLQGVAPKKMEHLNACVDNSVTAWSTRLGYNDSLLKIHN